MKMEMETLTTERALAFLQRRSTTNGDSVLTHLTHLIRTILDTRPQSAVDVLETSLLLKQTRLIVDEGPPPPRLLKERGVTDVKTFIELFSQPTKVLADTEVEDRQVEIEEPSSNECEIDNLLSDSAFFQAVGVGVGQTEIYLIVLALKQLSGEKGVASARFFGKIFGTSSNYYVFETKTIEDNQDEHNDSEDAKNEKELRWGRPVETIPPEKGEGPNANVYWVCSKLGEKLYRLPDVTPMQIKTARSLKKFFTGNLNAEVSAYPPFPGVEENFLRAQIARISATTLVVPKGYFKVPEAEDEETAAEMVKDEEWVSPPPAELAVLESWVHKNPYINLQGRCSLYTLQKDGDEDQEADEEAEEAQEETPPTPEEQESIPERLASIDNDSNMSGGVKPWSVTLSSRVPDLKHQIVCLRSFLWPGAYAIATPLGSFSNIYVGWGLKNVAYTPPAPPIVLTEYEVNVLESKELPPLPKPEEPESGEQEEDEVENEEGEEAED